MLKITNGKIEFSGNKQVLIQEFICLVSNFSVVSKLDEKEIKKISGVINKVFLKEDVSDKVAEYRIEQKEVFLEKLYEDLNIKRIGSD